MSSPLLQGRLALLANVGELLVAIDASQVRHIQRSPETATRRIEHNLYALDLERQTVPGWDLGELLGLGPCTTAWLVIDVHRLTRTIGLRVGRCIAVRKLPRCSRIPSSAFATRHGAIEAAFAASEIEEVAGTPSGVVLNLARLLTPAELDAGARLEGLREASA